MKAIPDHRLLSLWSQTRGQPPAVAALMVLAEALPGTPPAELGGLPLPTRDALLLELRRAQLGDQVRLFATCPRCGADMDFFAGVDELAPRAPEEQVFELEMEGRTLRCRAPNAADLALASRCADDTEAAELIARRCVLSVSGPPLEQALRLSDWLGDAFDARMSSEEVELVCGDCGLAWRTLLDAASLLNTELKVRAQRLMEDVHALAQAYGWTEEAVLALPDDRRQFYVRLAAP